MDNNFPQCLKFVLAEEGGNSDDPKDHGGRTSRGVTQKEYWAYQDKIGKPNSDVWKATDNEIKNIYRDYYWNPYCPQLPSGVDLEFFDMNVNAGLKQAVKTLQRAIGGSLPVDGSMGIRTITAAQEYENLNELINSYSDWRGKFYQQLAQFSIYGKGWLARNARCRMTALKLAAGAKSLSKPTAPLEPKSPKALASDADEAIITPEQAGGASAGFGTAGGAIGQIQDQLSPYQWTLSIIQYILLALAVISIGLMIYGLIRRSRIKAVT